MTQENIKTRVVGVDIKLERTTIAIVDVRGNVISKSDFPTGYNPNVGDFISTLSNNIISLLEANGGYETIRSVGICCSSANFLTGCIENAANLPWKGVVPMAAMLRDRLGLAVALGNNAHARALGEHAYGMAHGMKDFILVTLGSGMGSCFFSNGQQHLGRDGFAGEVGHTCAKHDGRVLAESDEPSLLRQVEDVTPEELKMFCDQGDKLTIEVMNRTGYMLGLGLANYASVINPEAIIFTGNVSHIGDWLLNPAYEAFNSHVFHNIEGKVRFLLSNFEDSEANLLGASVLAWNVKEYSLFK